ncbi:MAG: hypothetical protein HOY69_12660 [Streptomyces sp.]|nr:hypothetical protein [Streptomyces sp.]
MSYDLEWADLPEPAASARARYDACDWLDDPPCPHRPPCLDTYLDLVHPYSFHATVATMSRHLSAMRAAGMCSPDDPAAGVPEAKLTSNGPSAVTPEEIARALTAYEASPPAVRARLAAQDRYWPDWLDWLRACREHGGFIVR